MTAALPDPFDDGNLALVPLAEEHRERLRAACSTDDTIWAIYPVSFGGEHFDPAFDAMFAAANRMPFAVLLDDVVVGTTSYWLDAPNDVVEIGGTFLVPVQRGTGLNGRIKRLMIDRAFALRMRRVEFRIDTRNKRSIAAVEKLGATREGVLRRNRLTWSGHPRDTAVYSLLAVEWP